jgi:hypothetical protein
MFLRQPENVQAEIRGVDESHILFATVLDADDVRGVWIELVPNKPNQIWLRQQKCWRTMLRNMT